MTGLPKSGKSTLAYALERKLFDAGKFAVVLDGENLRATINADLGFSADDRREAMRRAASTARLLNDAGIIAIVASISPYAADRKMARTIIGEALFIEAFVSATEETCRARAPALYAKADSGEVPVFSGITAPYELPESAAITLDTTTQDVDTCATALANLL